MNFEEDYLTSALNQVDFNDDDMKRRSKKKKMQYFEEEDIEQGLEMTQEDDSKTKKKKQERRGRPPLIPFNSDVPQSPISVRSIPCFYHLCKYSYKRPGSTILEISDRPLIVTYSKYQGYSIRSCKKHSDHWKVLYDSKETCELCRGLNIDGEDKNIYKFENDNKEKFYLCRNCSTRQSPILKISSEQGKLAGNTREYQNQRIAVTKKDITTKIKASSAPSSPMKRKANSSEELNSILPNAREMAFDSEPTISVSLPCAKERKLEKQEKKRKKKTRKTRKRTTKIRKSRKTRQPRKPRKNKKI